MIPPETTSTETVDVSTADTPAEQERPSETEPRQQAPVTRAGHNIVLEDLHAYYREQHAVKGIGIEFPAHEVTAIIGPSGCGKSTMVRCINRMHEEIPGARAEGSVKLDQLDLYAPGVDVTSVRRLIGMVFQKPNPFPTMSIFDNVAAGLRLTGTRGENLRERVHKALRAVGLWGEVKHRLEEPGIGLSGGQQQRLCIARTIAVEPEVILMDEPCSALDPVATLKIEELIDELKDRYTIVIVTHNMQQAGRVSNTARLRRSSPGPRTSAPSATSPGSSGRPVQETRHHFREALKELERQALGGLDMVTNALDRALEAISYQDVELAAMVVADDDRIDGRYLEVHQGILSLLAREAPVAGDLRVVAALLHVIRCVERMGDQCVNIAKLVPLSGYEAPKDKDILDAIERMGQLARSQVAQAKESFTTRNAELAQDLVRQDAEINRLNREIFRRAVEVGDNLDVREWAMFMILVARCLERVGDNTVDIAEQTVFVVTGLFRELSDASAPPAARA